MSACPPAYLPACLPACLRVWCFYLQALPGRPGIGFFVALSVFIFLVKKLFLMKFCFVQASDRRDQPSRGQWTVRTSLSSEPIQSSLIYKVKSRYRVYSTIQLSKLLGTTSFCVYKNAQFESVFFVFL
jgi:hypothetical protein